MTTRERIIGNRIWIEIVSEDLEEASEAEESSRVTVMVDLVPDAYSER